MSRKKNRTTKTTMALTMAVALACSSQMNAFAEEQKADEYTLDPVVVTAQRKETKDLETPASVTVITAEDLKRTGALSVFDALEQTIGVTSYSYGTAGADAGDSVSRFYLRGLDKGTLVLVNGVPINLNNYNSTAGIPVDAVEKIEIIKGSNSVLYGAEAMGGVVNIITKKAGNTQKTSTSVGYGNYNKKWSINTSGDRYSFYCSKDYLGQVDQASLIAPKTAKYWKNLKGDTESYFLTGRLTDELSFNWATTVTNFNRDYMNAKNGASLNTLNMGYRYNTKRNNVNLVYDDKEDGYKSVLAYNAMRLDTKKISSANVISRGNAYDLNSWTFDNQKNWQFNKGADSLIGGLVFKRESYQELADRNRAIDRNDTALYASYTHQFTPKFSTILGVRGEFVQGNGYDQSHNVFLPQLQTLYKINNQMSWYTNIGKSFEMPAINSKYYLPKVSARNILEPQEGWTYETGLKKIRATDSAKLAVFHMDMDNKFKWVKADTVFPGGDPTTSIQINEGKFRNTGVELEYAKVLSNQWKWNFGASYSTPESNDGGKWVQESARVQFNAGVECKWEKWQNNLTWMYTGDREDSGYLKNGSPAGSNPDHKTPDRIQLNATLKYQATKDDAVVLNMYNLLDRDNCINKYENWDLPFNWMLSFNHTF